MAYRYDKSLNDLFYLFTLDKDGSERLTDRTNEQRKLQSVQGKSWSSIKKLREGARKS